ncbi:MAG: HD domain-containing protein [Candidatus Dormibacteraeota bacterium]|nr:HD domain-containing protein [Candidatus Dormibacteraeota bacterium]
MEEAPSEPHPTKAAEFAGAPDEVALPWPPGRLGAQLRFFLETDRLKGILRQTRVAGGARRENTAEHSWQLAVLAVVLAEHAPAGLDGTRVLRMLLVHDIVEVDAGDTFIYDGAAQAGKVERERAAADRLFGLLPDDQARELRDLWEEFEGRESPEARFAAAVDRLAPLVLNFVNGGGTWREHRVPAARVRAVSAQVGDGAPGLQEFVRSLLQTALDRGWLEEDPVRR